MQAVSYAVDDGAAIVSLASPPLNALSLEVRADLLRALERAAGDEAVRAVVLTGSGGVFSAGADAEEFATARDLEPPVTRELLLSLETLAKPVVAALTGLACGTGLELALACDARIAAREARLGLAAVRLGLTPEAGGTLRFTQLAGAAAALEALTGGRLIAADEALRLGLVDRLSDDALADAVERALRAALTGRAERALRAARGRRPRVASAPGGRPGEEDAALFAAWRSRIAARARGQLAPQRIVDCIEAACTRPEQEALGLERERFLECRASAQHRALLHVSRAEREAPRIPGLPEQVRPLPIGSAAVVGAGTMGAGIAMCFAGAGIPVALLESSPEALRKGLDLIRRNYAASVARGSLPQARADAALALIRAAAGDEDIEGVDIVIEAVFEDLEVKRAVFARLDGAASARAILATNTSTLDIDAIAAGTAHPERVVGTHFFSPANVMRLLENVRGRQTSLKTLATVMALGQRLGKVPVLAGNCEGFIGNRMLTFYGAEAEFLLEEGATPGQIDRVMEEFGFAMGPLAVRDLAGNDTGLAIRQRRRLPADERWSPILERMVAAGRLGQKRGIGYYRYEGRTRVPDPEVVTLIEGVSRDLGIRRRDIADEEILRRLLHPLVNEGARILEEGIALRAGDIDVVYVNGYGFPASRGGPMYWAQQSGFAPVIETMRRLAPTHGERWRPAPLLERLAAAGEGWEPQMAAGATR